MTTAGTPVLVLGAGPAGLGAAWQLARRGFDVTVIEREAHVGGNAGSFDFEGFTLDYGSHRLHPACAPEILADIQRMLGADLLDRPRHGRIRLRNRWLHFPLRPLDLVAHLPPAFIGGVARDTAMKPFQQPRGDSFAAVLEHGLGATMCRDFYFPYARKIWGADPATLDAEQARRRVSAGSPAKMLRKALHAVPGLKPKGAGRFFYPRQGYGQISEAYLGAVVAAGGRVSLRTTLERLVIRGGRVVSACVRGADSGVRRVEAAQVLSTVPVTSLVRAADAPAPAHVIEAARSLRFRSMLLVYLVLEVDRFTEYDAHYFPDESIAITRLSEPKNYGLGGVPGRTVLCAELPCAHGDRWWAATDDELEAAVVRALAAAGLPAPKPSRVLVKRISHAYPIYDRGYRDAFNTVDDWVSRIDGVVTFGRQGLFAHDNTHHALAMAYTAAACVTDRGGFDRARWGEHRRAFEHHVVED